MADRFPLIVNAVSKKIEEIVAGDNLELTGNGIVISGDSGAGKYLSSDGSTVFWGSPGDVYLTQTQTLTNKTLESSTISGSLNTITNLPNSSLVNSGITVNGTTVSLGGSVTTPNDDTKYSVSAVDGLTAAQKIIRLTDSASVTDDVIFAVGSPASVPAGSNALSLSLSRTDDTITILGSVVDNNTVTRIQSFTGGTLQSGDITFKGTGGATISQDSGTKTITINTANDDTITRLRAGTGQTYQDGDFTLLAGNEITLSQGVDVNSDPTITISSVDTITRIKGGGSGTLVTGDVTFEGGPSGNIVVSQTGNTVTIEGTDTNTVTQLASGASPLASGNFRFIQGGATTITETNVGGVTTFEISSRNDDTGASLGAAGGVIVNGSNFELKNNTNLVDTTVLKWDSANGQLANGIITDDGSTITINGDLQVTGTNTIIETTTLQVADNIVELRKGNNLTGTDSGIQINRTTDAGGAILTFQQLQWFESGGYWRSYDGSIGNRFVTENETQILTNKTLTSPTLTSPTLGQATATTINGLTINSTSGSTIDVADLKTITFNNTITFNANDGSTINFGNGGGPGATLAYTSNNLGSFATTTSTQLRGVVSDATGTGVVVFSVNPVFSTSIRTSGSSISVFNTSATTVNAFGAAQVLNLGADSGTTTINNSLTVAGSAVEFNEIVGDTFTVNGTANFENADIIIRGGDATPLKIGRGGGGINTNTRVGYSALESNQSGSQNTAMGYGAALENVSGAANSGYGYRSLYNLTTGSNNNAIGKDSQLQNDTGIGNISIGNSTLENNIEGDYNVCIGHFAGYSLQGSGNVLIGPASDEDSTNVTYVPPSSTGSNQLVIGSGTGAWIRGDSSFGVTIPNDFRVNGSTTIDGDLTVSGTTVTVNSNVITVDDKNIELAAVTGQTFDADITNGSNIINNVTLLTGLIPGMTISSPSGGVSIPADTYIFAINGADITLSAAVSGSDGTATFIATGPTDLGADGGGIIVKGTPVASGGTGDKTILYDHSRTDKYWVLSENLELRSGKKFVIGNQKVLDSTSLGDTVVNSKLTSVGVLSVPAGETNPALEVDGSIVFGGRVIEQTFSNFSANFTVTGNTLNVVTAAANTILGTTPTSAINTWAFNTEDSNGNALGNGQSMTVTLFIDANTAATYGDDCTVDGNTVTNGVRWSGGSPPIATTNTDILTFVIVKDSSGVVRVFGQGNTDFS